MSKRSIRSTCHAAVATSLIVALLAQMPFADGLLLHDHSDHGVHSHAVTLDDLRDGDLATAWHRHHDEEQEDGDTDGGDFVDSLFLFMNDPAIGTAIYCSAGRVVASIHPLCSRVIHRSTLPDAALRSSDPGRIYAASWPSAHPLRPAFALDALLQSSLALLL